MALKRPKWLDGQLVELEHHSSVLKSNPLGDPSVRKLPVMVAATVFARRKTNIPGTF